MENKPFNEYIAQLDKIFNLVNTTNTNTISKNAENYIGSRNSKGQPHGKGSLIDSDGIRFTGNWINGILSGIGVIEYLDGKYEGEIRDSKPNGKGKLISSNGDYYEGDWDNGFKHGIGNYVWNNGKSYQGGWVLDKQEGNGIEKSKNGVIIKEGRWKNGTCILINSGDSVKIKIEGSFGKGTYTGSIKDGKPNGLGKADYENGQYEGEWKNGKKEGNGKFTWKTGNIGHVFNGRWVNDIRDGFGKQIYANGDIYEGEWKDKRSGEGKMTYADGTVYEGEWKDGKPIVKDIDGNVYSVVKIGKQIWMAENLQTSRYRNGNRIPNISNNEDWKSLDTGACCNYLNDSENGKIYGKLYNWYAVVDYCNIAPTGWHIPTDKEWETLINYLGGDELAGVKLKEAGTTHWKYNNNGATNNSGFSALPGGFRLNLAGSFNGLGSFAYWWSIIEDDGNEALCIRTLNECNALVISSGEKWNGYSVRCIKDN